MDTYTIYERDDYMELIFDRDIPESRIDPINDHIYAEFGQNCTIDWRDDRTCWVWNEGVTP